MGITHVVWDWNGTLLNDFEIMVAATSASCEDLIGRPVTATEYRTHFTRPVHLLYEGLLGRRLSDDEWRQINLRFHDCYGALVATAALVDDAPVALRAVAESGRTQSLLSMWLHAELQPTVDRLGIGAEFLLIEGLPTVSDGSSKHSHLVDHLERLGPLLDGTVDPTSVLVIGDSVDDAVAARAVGAPCVLVEGGSHHASDLASAGVPIAASLLDALKVGQAIH